jgi:hypothetical protein
MYSTLKQVYREDFTIIVPTLPPSCPVGICAPSKKSSFETYNTTTHQCTYTCDSTSDKLCNQVLDLPTENNKILAPTSLTSCNYTYTL